MSGLVSNSDAKWKVFFSPFSTIVQKSHKEEPLMLNTVVTKDQTVQAQDW